MLHAQLVAPAGAAFTVESAEPPTDGFNAPNPGARLLVATVTAPADGTLRLAVVLAPGDIVTDAPELTALTAWAQPGDTVSEAK